MKNKLLIILILSVFAVFPSCKKAPLTIGKIVTETRALPDFLEVYLNDDISLSLVRSDTCYIEITTGENLIDNITTEVNGNILTIKNTNELSWIRPYNYELHAILYYKDIRNFIFSSSGTLETKNQYNESNHSYLYRFEIDGGSGDLNLLFNNCTQLDFVYKYGTSHVTLHGDNNVLTNIIKKSYGILDAQNLQSQRVDIQSNSPADCYIWATDSINAKINHHGNIYYKGDPENIQVTYGDYAEGKLLHIN